MNKINPGVFIVCFSRRLELGRSTPDYCLSIRGYGLDAPEYNRSVFREKIAAKPRAPSLGALLGEVQRISAESDVQFGNTEAAFAFMDISHDQLLGAISPARREHDHLRVRRSIE